MKQTGRREHLARRREPAPGDDHVAQPRRVASEQSRVHRRGHTRDRDVLPADPNHSGGLGLRVQDLHDIRIRVRAGAIDHDLVVAGAGLAVVDEQEAAWQADRDDHSRDADEDCDQRERGPQWARESVADAKHDRPGQSCTRGGVPQGPAAGTSGRRSLGDRCDRLEQAGPQRRHGGCQGHHQQPADEQKQVQPDRERRLISQAERVGAVGQQRLAHHRAHRYPDQTGGKGRDDNLECEHSDDLRRREPDRLHDPDLAVGRDNDSSHESRDDRDRCCQRKYAECGQHPGQDLVGDVEDAADQDVVQRPSDASGWEARAHTVDVALQLSAGRVIGEAIIHEVVGRVRRRQGRHRGRQDPRVLAAEVCAALVDVDDLARHRQCWRRLDADDLQPVAYRDVVELRKRAGEDDLVVADRPAARRDVEHFHRSARVVTADSIDVELAVSKLELDVGDGVRTPGRGGADGGRRFR